MTLKTLQRNYEKEFNLRSYYGEECGCYSPAFVKWLFKKYELEKTKRAFI
jgi:hypothetical protein